MTIRHLRIFVAVAETGKMYSAAERCFLSQPTVSQAIRELEEHYGVRLFERFSKKLYITEAGSQLLTYARGVLSQFDVMETNMGSFHADTQLRLGATITVGACLLSSILNDLKKRHPLLQIYSCVANTQLIERKLLNSELDVALVEGVITNPSLVSIPVVDDYLVLAVSTTHPLAKKKQIHIREVIPYEFVFREKGSGTRKLFEHYLEKHGITCHIAMEATCLDAIKNAILYNNYISASLPPVWWRRRFRIKKSTLSATGNPTGTAAFSWFITRISFFPSRCTPWNPLCRRINVRSLSRTSIPAF